MKKIVLFIVVFLAFFSARAQITQSESDSIVLQRMNQEIRQCVVYAKNNIQIEMNILTSKGEVLELDYSCWVYFINYTEEENNNAYLIVKESNGSLLEINIKDDTISNDLTEWRKISEEICNADNPLTDLPWLKEKIDEFNLLAQENENLSISIYQCKYGSGEIGFLVDEGNTKPFYNCSGELLCIMGGFAGETCSELNIDFQSKKFIWEINYLIKIPFTEYSLVETSCQWEGFESNKVIIINNDEELREYVVCTEDNYSKIDFSEHSLLLTRGRSATGFRYIDIKFFEEETNEYTLAVTIHTDRTAAALPWLISIITPKIQNETTITLNVQQIND